jgi:phosphohistidine swiveling domain-containing protein
MDKRPSLKFIKENDWFFFHKRYRSAFYQTVLVGSSLQDKRLPFDTRVKFFGRFDTSVVLDMSEKERLANKAWQYLKKDPGYMLRLMNDAYKQKEQNTKQWQKLSHRDLNKATNKELATMIKNYSDELLTYGIYISLPLFFEARMEQTIKDYLEKKFGPKLAEEYFHIIADPVKDGAVLQEEIGLLKLALKKKVSQKDLALHQHKFCWMANVGFTEDYYPIEYYAKKLAKVKKANPKTRLNYILNDRAIQRRNFQKLLNKIDDKFILNLATIANEAVYFRSFRTEMYYSSSRFMKPLFVAIAKRFGVRNYKDVVWLYWDEIPDLLLSNKRPSLKLISQRKKCLALLSDYDGRFWKWDGKDAIAAAKAYEASLLKHDKNAKEIKGSPAFPGIISGRASVVMSLKEVHKVKQGDILITHATNVNFVSTLRKVVGLVTEEGGILSHAAIISREMKIPTVIGTKVATKIFKDGDMVEVDANKGMVRKI